MSVDTAGAGQIVRLFPGDARKTDRVSHHGTEQHHPDNHDGSDPFRFIQRPAEDHDLQCQGDAQFRDHCD